MSSWQDLDPHAEYRRQAAQHFNAPPDTAPSTEPASAAPKIYRGPATPSSRPQTSPAPRTDRFTAGTTYTGRGAAPPPRIPTPPSRPTPPPQPPPVDHRPPAPTGFPVGSPAPGNAWHGEPQGLRNQGDSVAPSLAVQPFHVLWGLAALSLSASLILGFGWVLVAAGCGAAAYFTQARGTAWHPDLLAVLTRSEPASGTVRTPATPVVPLRPLSFLEMFTGAFRILGRNWPTLVGIPVAILVALAVVCGVASAVVMSVAVSSASLSTSLFESADATSALGGLFGVMIVLWLLFCALAFPADAALLALSVSATDKAVRGRPVRMKEVVREARSRILPVCRLTLVYYGIFILIDGSAMGVVLAAFAVGLPLALLLMALLFVGSFVVGIMFSLAPLVMIIEKRGVIDSLRRSMQLAKPAAGRLLGVHLIWAVCVTPVLSVPGLLAGFVLGPVGALLFFVIAFGALIAYVRVLQVLIYTDLRMRQERFDTELAADWARNTGGQPWVWP